MGKWNEFFYLFVLEVTKMAIKLFGWSDAPEKAGKGWLGNIFIF